MLISLITALLSGESNPALLLTEICMVLAIVLFSLSAHEAAHAYAAKRLGDYTAYYQGRITLNPMKHLNPLGVLMMALVGIGWANPVPINPRNFREPRKGMMLSSLAGPLSNLILAVIATFFSCLMDYLIYRDHVNGRMTDNSFYVCLSLFFFLTAYLNYSLAVFNLIPCPPFDGSRIFFYFLPKSWYFRVMRYERYLGIGILLLVLGLSYVAINPVSYIVGELYTLISGPFNKFFSLIFDLPIYGLV